jgi:hypothetical protein
MKYWLFLIVTSSPLSTCNFVQDVIAGDDFSSLNGQADA